MALKPFSGFSIAKATVRVYLHFDSYSKTYGLLEAVTILLLWLHVTGLAFLVEEINAEIENDSGSMVIRKQNDQREVGCLKCL